MFDEDKERVLPGVQRARAEGLNVSGPIAPDSVFRHAVEGKYDAIVTLYHDQGQIPLKTSAFEGACTVFMGMPYVTVTVPHGSAYEIAGKGQAQHLSMLAAITTAAKLGRKGDFSLA
jgi:4-hydroxythreonine-4-phosphate dehydrogenase